MLTKPVTVGYRLLIRFKEADVFESDVLNVRTTDLMNDFFSAFFVLVVHINPSFLNLYFHYTAKGVQ